MDPQYTVSLHAGQTLPAPQRIAAEIRFAAALERALGEPQAVVATLQAWQQVTEFQANEVDKRTAARAVQWPKAFEQAARAGLEGLPGARDAGFEVRLAKQAP